MTKFRPPLTVGDAIIRIAAQLDGGFREMAQVANREERTVRNWSDPDTPESIPVDCAIALDLAFAAAGGTGTPIFEAYGFQLKDAAAARFADQQQLLRLAQSVAKETGEANTAILGAAQPDASAADRRAALEEIGQAIGVLKDAIPLLSAQIADAQPP
jgi:hypothetical protein